MKEDKFILKVITTLVFLYIFREVDQAAIRESMAVLGVLGLLSWYS